MRNLLFVGALFIGAVDLSAQCHFLLLGAGKCASASAPVNREQTAMGGGDASQGSSVTAVFGSNVTSGNLIVCGIRNQSNTLSSVSDSLGTSFSSIGPVGVAQAAVLWIYYGSATSTGANTVTTSWSSTNYVWVYCVEVSGMATSSQLDTSDTQTFASGVTDITTDPITTTQAKTYVMMIANQAGFASYTAGTDFTLVDGTIPTNAQNFGGVEQYIPGAVLNSYTPHITSSSSAAAGSAIVAAFKGS